MLLKNIGVIAAVVSGAMVGCSVGGSGSAGSQSHGELGAQSQSVEVSNAVDAGVDGSVCSGPACSTVTVQVVPSLEMTTVNGSNAAIFANFSLAAVLQQLLDQAGAKSETPDDLLRRLFDPYNDADGGVFHEPFAPHCASTFDGFPLECPRVGDGDLAKSTTTTTEFAPVGIFNRFDLAPSNGANCGEYRIIYWSQSSDTTDLGTIIFEGQLPNPQPGCIQACQPVAQFWQSLAGLSQANLATAVQTFFFDGLGNGFGPVIDIHNYGSNGGGGQIRVDTIDTADPSAKWQLRENRLATNAPSAATPTLFVQPVPVSTNPFGGLFADASADFITAFTKGAKNPVKTLAAANINNIKMTLSNTFDPGQSTSETATIPDDYALEKLDPKLATAIQDALPDGSALTPANIVARAMTQSCAGCHNLSANLGPPPALGGGLTWPKAGTTDYAPEFVQVGPAGDISQALQCVFLPHRQSVLAGFLENCGKNPAEIVPPGCSQQAEAPLDTPDPDGTLGGGGSVN